MTEYKSIIKITKEENKNETTIAYNAGTGDNVDESLARACLNVMFQNENIKLDIFALEEAFKNLNKCLSKIRKNIENNK